MGILNVTKPRKFDRNVDESVEVVLLLTKNVLAESCSSGYYPINPGDPSTRSWLQHEYRRNNQDVSAAKGHVTG